MNRSDVRSYRYPFDRIRRFRVTICESSRSSCTFGRVLWRTASPLVRRRLQPLPVRHRPDRRVRVARLDLKSNKSNRSSRRSQAENRCRTSFSIEFNLVCNRTSSSVAICDISSSLVSEANRNMPKLLLLFTNYFFSHSQWREKKSIFLSRFQPVNIDQASTYEPSLPHGKKHQCIPFQCDQRSLQWNYPSSFVSKGTRLELLFFNSFAMICWRTQLEADWYGIFRFDTQSVISEYKMSLFFIPWRQQKPYSCQIKA